MEKKPRSLHEVAGMSGIDAYTKKKIEKNETLWNVQTGVLTKKVVNRGKIGSLE